jgi:hypothetical protein
MQQNKRRASGIFLILGIAFLAVGLATANTAFSWIAIVFVLISLLANSRWLKPRKK